MAKIALAQFDSVLKNVEANVEKMVAMIEKAALNDADIIVFPELFTTGYNLDLIEDEILEMAEDRNGPAILSACKTAAENGIWVIAPLAYRDGEKIYNSAVIIDSDGNIVNIYHKNNLWDKEQKYFEYGCHDYQVYNASFGKFGVIVCYDVDFPETSRSLAMSGAEIIFVPAAWATTHRNLWDIFLPSRALENTVFVAGINRTGVEGDVVYFGDSKVFDPTGELIIRAGENIEEILYCDIDVSSIPVIRKNFPYLKELRKDY
ncbi:MAG: carbon-nitrogen hydrolase [Clostridiales bacterium]|nr:carbon-nitrogen hydrolase [Clostridiales bacterium]